MRKDANHPLEVCGEGNVDCLGCFTLTKGEYRVVHTFHPIRETSVVFINNSSFEKYEQGNCEN